jgi:signal transduction histidine kinase
MVGDPANLSREFRMLVTSIRGPLEEELADRAAPVARRERLRTLRRDFVRLLELVTALFDLSGIEAGARRPAPMDLAAETVVIPLLRNAIPLPSREQHPADGFDAAVRAAKLERVNQALEAFSYAVSQDLEAPVRAVNGFSRILLSHHAHSLDQDGRALVEQIHTHAQRMGAIIDEMIDSSRSRS